MRYHQRFFGTAVSSAIDSFAFAWIYDSGVVAGDELKTERPKVSGETYSLRFFLGLLILAFAYFISAKAGLLFSFKDPTVTIVWLPGGLSLAALLRFGYRCWPGVAFGHMLLSLNVNTPPVFILLLSANATIVPLLTTWFLKDVLDFEIRMMRIRDVLYFLGFGVAGYSVMSAIIGTMLYFWMGEQNVTGLLPIAGIWWASTAAGALLATPLVLSFPGKEIAHFKVLKIIEFIVMLALLIVVCLVAFSGQTAFGLKNYPLTFLPFPLLIWASLRFGMTGASIGSLIVSSAAVAGTTGGVGPLVMESLLEEVMIVWSYISLITVTTLFLSSVNVQKKEMERRLLSAKAETERANESKSLFLANMGHEIRTPLNSIAGTSELLQGTPLGEEQKELVDSLQRSSNTLLEIVGDILELARLEAGKYKPEATDFSLSILLEEVMGYFHMEASLKELSLDYAIDPRVKDELWGDAPHLRQVLLNIVGNAVKFTSRGWIKIKVSPCNAARVPEEQRSFLNQKITSSGMNQLLHFEVIDTGCGIEPKFLSQVFEQFMQEGSNKNKKHDGIGLGLAICRQLVLLMGGTIWVESAKGHGSTFHFLVRVSEKAEGNEDCILF